MGTTEQRALQDGGSPAEIPASIAETPTGAFLILQLASNPGDQAEPSAAVLLKPDGSAVAMQALRLAGEKWELFADQPDQKAILSSVRRAAAAEVDRLIDLLNAIDADPDLESNGDEAEPTLGSSNDLYGQGASYAVSGDDREGDDEREHDIAEAGIGDDGGLNLVMQEFAEKDDRLQFGQNGASLRRMARDLRKLKRQRAR